MTTATSARTSKSQAADVAALRSSPVHGLVPLYPKPVSVQIEDIEIDTTNPGSVTQSMRNERRVGSIRDSYDILARIIYPIIVCQKPGGGKGYIHIDGFGRLSEAKARGQREIDAIVYAPLNTEQRICLRQTLNAAQEPFDAVSIIHDLRELAKERHLDITNPEHIKTLVRDMPERVRRYEADLIMLARVHPLALQAIGESYRKDGKTIGLDKFREVARILKTMEDRHPDTVRQIGGAQELSLKLSKMYLDKKFSGGTRSQDAFRRVATALQKTLPPDDPSIAEFFVKEQSYADLMAVAEMHSDGAGVKGSSTGAASSSYVNLTRNSPVIDACDAFERVLNTIDLKALTHAETLRLDRTGSVLRRVLRRAKA